MATTQICPKAEGGKTLLGEVVCVQQEGGLTSWTEAC